MHIPADYPVQPIEPNDPSAIAPTTCGHCGLTWDDGKVTSMTPAPSARCPFEAFHEEDEDDEEGTYYYDPPAVLANTVFDPTSHTFGPIMAALQAGNFEAAAMLTAKLIESDRDPSRAIANFANEESTRAFQLTGEGTLIEVTRAHRSDVWSPPETVARYRSGTPLFAALGLNAA